MSEQKPNVEELSRRVDQLLDILKEITQDLKDVSKSLKATVAPPPTPAAPTAPAAPIASTPPTTPVARMRSVSDVKMLFPKELEDMLTFDEAGEHIIVKPRQYLGSENFAKIASLIRGAGGEYISAGKESHFKVPKEIA